MENLQIPKMPQLRKCENSFKLVIPVNVEQKIRHLCSRISTVEWSGTLFYTFSGTYEDNNLEIKCVNIFPMDIGSSTYTEFDMSPDVIAYMTDHPELLDCQIGLVHSHAGMQAFFSGTDLSTLQEEGVDRNHFVSLIVNNEGTYTAAITRRVKSKEVVNSTYTYKTFDDVEKTGNRSYEIEEEVIEYNYLDIIKEGEVENPFLELDQRLSTIKESKTKKATTPFMYNISYNKDKVAQPTLFDTSGSIDTKSTKTNSYKEVSMDPNDDYISDSTIKTIVLQLITGSIAIGDNSKIDPVKWAPKMVGLFSNRFKDDDSFETWAWTMIDFIVTNSVPPKYEQYSDVYIMDLCSEIYETLKELPQNKYIRMIQNTLLLWMK